MCCINIIICTHTLTHTILLLYVIVHYFKGMYEWAFVCEQVLVVHVFPLILPRLSYPRNVINCRLLLLNPEPGAGKDFGWKHCV